MMAVVVQLPSLQPWSQAEKGCGDKGYGQWQGGGGGREDILSLKVGSSVTPSHQCYA